MPSILLLLVTMVTVRESMETPTVASISHHIGQCFSMVCILLPPKSSTTLGFLWFFIILCEMNQIMCSGNLSCSSSGCFVLFVDQFVDHICPTGRKLFFKPCERFTLEMFLSQWLYTILPKSNKLDYQAYYHNI
jgi:hypothetical protein